MPSVVPRRSDVTPNNDVPLERRSAADAPGSTLARLCAAGFVAYCSYSICRTPLLPLFARELGAGPSMIGFVMGASTLTGIFLKLPAGAWSDILGRRPLLFQVMSMVGLSMTVAFSLASRRRPVCDVPHNT